MRAIWRLVVVVAVGLLAFAVSFDAADAQTLSAACSGTIGDVASLKSAISAANVSSPGPDTISLGAGCVYTLTAVDNNWYGPNGLPAIASDITIDGNGATIARSTALATPSFRLFFVGADPVSQSTLNYISPGAGTLTLHDLTLTGGLARGGSPGFGGGGGGGGFGGAVFSQGTVVMDRVLLTANTAEG